MVSMAIEHVPMADNTTHPVVSYAPRPMFISDVISLVIILECVLVTVSSYTRRGMLVLHKGAGPLTVARAARACLVDRCSRCASDEWVPEACLWLQYRLAGAGCIKDELWNVDPSDLQ